MYNQPDITANPDRSKIWILGPVEFVELQATFTDSEKSWTIDAEEIDPNTFDLSVKNPNKPKEAPLREPQEIIAEIVALDAESAGILKNIRRMM